MHRVNEFRFYELAVAIHPLTTASEQEKYSDIWITWGNSAQSLSKIFQERALEFCFEAANELYAAIGNVVPHDFAQAIEKFQQLPEPEQEQEIGWGFIHPIRQAVEKFETILGAELSNSDTYWVSPKGTHKTSMLMRSAHSVLPDSITRDYPSAAADFDEAGRCWLFDTYTAAGFHLMRATESVIRKYYRAVTGIEPKVKFRNWGAYITNLEKCPQADQKIVQFLKQIKDHYRNPILHPEQNLSAEDCQILVGVCISAISLMAVGIRTLTETGQQLPLTESAKLLS